MSLDDLIRDIQALPVDPLRRLAAAVEVSATIGQVGDHLVSHFIDEARWRTVVGGHRLAARHQPAGRAEALRAGERGRA
jgi:hypothetical protein